MGQLASIDWRTNPDASTSSDHTGPSEQKGVGQTWMESYQNMGPDQKVQIDTTLDEVILLAQNYQNKYHNPDAATEQEKQTERWFEYVKDSTVSIKDSRQRPNNDSELEKKFTRLQSFYDKTKQRQKDSPNTQKYKDAIEVIGKLKDIGIITDWEEQLRDRLKQYNIHEIRKEIGTNTRNINNVGDEALKQESRYKLDKLIDLQLLMRKHSANSETPKTLYSQLNELERALGSSLPQLKHEPTTMQIIKETTITSDDINQLALSKYKDKLWSNVWNIKNKNVADDVKLKEYYDFRLEEYGEAIKIFQKYSRALKKGDAKQEAFQDIVNHPNAMVQKFLFEQKEKKWRRESQQGGGTSQ